MKQVVIVFIFSLFLNTQIFGQIKELDLSQIGNVVHENGWIEFKGTTRIDALTLFDVYKATFDLSQYDEMRLMRSENDDLGYTHYRFAQYHNGIKIEGAEFIVHEKDSRAIKANGKIISRLTLNTSPTLSKQDAFRTALQLMPSNKYMWEDADEEKFLKLIKRDSSATYFPIPELVITSVIDSLDLSRDNITIAYKVDITTKIPFASYSIYVDASSGKEIKRVSLIQNCTNANSCSLYNGNQTIKTDFVSGMGYRLFDDCRGDGVHTIQNGSGNDIYNINTTWTTNCEYTQTHWAGEMTYDYFLQKHGRDSYDNNGSIMLQAVGNCTDQAYYFPNGLTLFCNGNVLANNWINSLDVVGHEWAHGVVQFSAGLTGFTTEAGALNESFSDIFGSMVECYAENLYDPTNPYPCEDFLIAEEMWNGGALRSMCNPHAYTNPDTYGGTYWSNDARHNRSGVQNKWFCLLSKGGSGINNHPSFQYSYNVTGIGKEKAAAISYRNLTVYLTPTSNYADARQGAIEAARDLYGDCSNEVLQTVEAWNAVGVYMPSVSTNLNVCGNYYDDTYPNILVAFNNIEAGDVCISPAYTTIHPDANVVFKAGNSIRLGNGFNAKAGSYFHAYIYSCSGGSYKTIADEVIFENNDTPDELTIFKNKDSKPTLSAHPNPFNASTEIKFRLYESNYAEIFLFDVYGTRIKILANRRYCDEGIHTVSLQKNELTPGIYYCLLSTSTESIVHKIIIL